jgi:hypothetical protein
MSSCHAIAIVKNGLFQSVTTNEFENNPAPPARARSSSTAFVGRTFFQISPIRVLSEVFIVILDLYRDDIRNRNNGPGFRGFLRESRAVQ